MFLWVVGGKVLPHPEKLSAACAHSPGAGPSRLTVEGMMREWGVVAETEIFINFRSTTAVPEKT